MIPDGLEVVNVTMERIAYEELVFQNKARGMELNSAYIKGEEYPDDPEWAKADEEVKEWGAAGYWKAKKKRDQRAYELRKGIKTHGIAEQLKGKKGY